MFRLHFFLKCQSISNKSTKGYFDTLMLVSSSQFSVIRLTGWWHVVSNTNSQCINCLTCSSKTSDEDDCPASIMVTKKWQMFSNLFRLVGSDFMDSDLIIGWPPVSPFKAPFIFGVWYFSATKLTGLADLRIISNALWKN